jgi:predicted secreted protein
MNWVAVVIIYLLSWWTIFFAVLPWGVKSRWESPDDGVKGAEPGAPVEPRLARKALMTSGLALVATLIIAGVLSSGVLNRAD